MHVTQPGTGNCKYNFSFWNTNFVKKRIPKDQSAYPENKVMFSAQHAQALCKKGRGTVLLRAP